MEKYQVFFTENEAKALKFCIDKLHLLGEEVSYNGVNSKHMLNKISNLVKNIELEKVDILDKTQLKEGYSDRLIKCEHCGSIEVFELIVGADEEGYNFTLYCCNECNQDTLIYTE